MTTKRTSWLTVQISAARKSISAGPQWLKNAADADYSASRRQRSVEVSDMADRKVVRDAGSGRFVPKKEATSRPRTTVTETVTRSAPAKTKKK